MKNVILLLTILISSCLMGQINVTIIPNPPSDLSAWEDGMSPVTVTVNNSGPEFEARFYGEIKKDGELKAKTNSATPILTIERGMNTFMVEDVVPYEAVELIGVNTKRIARTGKLPAGSYMLCIGLRSSTGQPSQGFSDKCVPFFLTSFQPPIAISPVDGMQLQGNQRPTFNWTPVTPAPKGFRVNYNLKVYEVLKGQNAIQAIRSNRPIIDEETNGVTQYWPVEWDLPEEGGDYVWQVQALDQDGNPFGEQMGLSEPQVFKLGPAGGGGNKIADGQEWTQCAAFTCSIKGVSLAIYVPWDASTTGSTTYKVVAYTVNIKYYATADQVLNEFGTTGAPEVDDWIGYIPSGYATTYCDKNGFPIVDQVVYEVTKPNPNNYNGNTNELHASGVCFDYDSYTNLANHYNLYNNSYLDVPTSCSEGCLQGGSNPNGGGTGTGGPTNAANQEIDDITLDPIDEDGGVKPGGGLNGYEPAPAVIVDPTDIIFVHGDGDNFKPYINKGEIPRAKDFCFCWDGSYCEGQPNCNCCPKREVKTVVNTKANVCDCPVKEGSTRSVLTGVDCKTACKSFKKYSKVKDIRSGQSSGKR
ncbi:hypothetical protein [Luteibaculum oceani]|uniref:Fibronectin type-III domain-containing protein n=1 Tax=Luteibaculum oceani TaxID=1294296 RepID=A0A5C6USN7_9FLAO|nr:hypothetical protein [Luteibaculum oceani]TXC75251.1 hypothetical protein FRX97_11975 [Luteibaculum oceani]